MFWPFTKNEKLAFDEFRKRNLLPHIVDATVVNTHTASLNQTPGFPFRRGHSLDHKQIAESQTLTIETGFFQFGGRNIGKDVQDFRGGQSAYLFAEENFRCAHRF